MELELIVRNKDGEVIWNETIGRGELMSLDAFTDRGCEALGRFQRWNEKQDAEFEAAGELAEELSRETIFEAAQEAETELADEAIQEEN